MTEPTTITDSLLDDLDDLSDVVEENNDEDDDESIEMREESQPTVASLSGVSFRKYLDDGFLKAHMEAVQKVTQTSGGSSKESQEREYQLVVQSNRHLARLREELSKAHTELCAAYYPRFSELEELIPNILQYKEAVMCIRNDLDTAQLNERLADFLSNSQIITITVAASTTSGRILDDEELQHIDAIAGYIDEVSNVQQTLVSFVEERMNDLAPSVCALIGPSLAARLLGLAGGLADLSKIPACNLQVMGQTKQNANSRAGMSLANSNPHQGLLSESELVQKCPKALRQKALKVVAAKLALAARCDFVNADTGRRRSAEAGERFRQEIERKFHKWEEPDDAPKLKSLPKPDLTIKKRRGGRRIRRMKERFEETAMMKQANTRAFSTQSGEYGDDAMGLTVGLLDTSGVTDGGTVRKNTEKRKIRHANTKASRKRQAQMATATSNQNGLASSVVFTPVQGMELVNPEANSERVREANKKWFSDNAGFQSALPRK